MYDMGKQASKYKRLETPKGNKDYRNCSQLVSDIIYPHKELKCPYCGQSMVIKNGTEIKTRFQDEQYFVCRNYPECDCYCRTLTVKGNKHRLVSTPADKKLRIMRAEAHHYLEAVINLGLYSYDPEHQTTHVYCMINDKTGLSIRSIAHIGECREYGCRQVANACVEILYKRKDKIKNYRPWEKGLLLDETHQIYISEIEKELCKNV